METTMKRPFFRGMGSTLVVYRSAGTVRAREKIIELAAESVERAWKSTGDAIGEALRDARRERANGQQRRA